MKIGNFFKKYGEFGILPLKLTQHLKIGLPNRKGVFQSSIFRGYVSFTECIHIVNFRAVDFIGKKHPEISDSMGDQFHGRK